MGVRARLSRGAGRPSEGVENHALTENQASGPQAGWGLPRTDPVRGPVRGPFGVWGG